MYYLKIFPNSFSIFALNTLLESNNNTSYQIGKFTLHRNDIVFKESNDFNDVIVKNSNVELAKKAVLISNIENKKKKQSNIDENDTAKPDNLAIDVSVIKLQEKIVESILGDTINGKLDTNYLQSIIDSAKLDLATLNKNSNEYTFLQNEIWLAEQKLADAKKIIALKEKEISQHKAIILFLTLIVLTILSILGLLYFFLNKIKMKNKEISFKSQKIKNSIEYAALIQNALLNENIKINHILPQSFLYFKPKDIVSGDFYWYKKIENKIIIVAADCTGHGVPGALLTMLGISALEKIVLQDKVYNPAEILLALDKDISLKLKDENPFQLNGIDLAICEINTTNRKLRYAGAMREIVVFSENGSTIMRPHLASIASKRFKNVTNQEIELGINDTIFMFSDGYQDQFRGNKKEIETYNHKRFQNLLAKIHKMNNWNDVNEFLNNDFNDWKGNREATDDVLLIGFRL